jgi:hypothetical protein
MQETMLFKTTLNQFLDYTLVKNNYDRLLHTIKQLSAAHNEVVRGVCSKIIRGFSLELLSTSLPATRQIFEQQ